MNIALRFLLAASLFGACTASGTSKDHDDSDVAPLVGDDSSKNVASSEETFASLEVRSYDLNQRDDGSLALTALDDNRASRGEFIVRTLDQRGATVDADGDVTTIEIAMTTPSQATLRIAVDGEEDEVLDDTFSPGSYEQRLAAAVERDLSSAGNVAAPDLSSSDPGRERAGATLGCSTEAKCKLLVMLCTDKCCNGTRLDDRGFPIGVDCVTVQKRHVCGACIGWDG